VNWIQTLRPNLLSLATSSRRIFLSDFLNKICPIHLILLDYDMKTDTGKPKHWHEGSWAALSTTKLTQTALGEPGLDNRNALYTENMYQKWKLGPTACLHRVVLTKYYSNVNSTLSHRCLHSTWREVGSVYLLVSYRLKRGLSDRGCWKLAHWSSQGVALRSVVKTWSQITM
jgi:hypothetical protein